MSTFYEFRMLNLPTRFRLPENSARALKALDDYEIGRIDEAELGRLIRLSPKNRASIIDTMIKLAEIMHKKPEESTRCLAVLKNCGKIISIADQSPPSVGFPSFMKLPREMRERVYDYYLSAGDTTEIMVPHPKRGACSCPRQEPSGYYPFQRKSLSLAFTSSRLHDEVLSYFFRTRIFTFPCACEMGHCLANNPRLKENARRIIFHWCGPSAHLGIQELRRVRLDNLTVVISKNTTRYVTPREDEFRRYFGPKRTSTGGYLCDALGVDELLQLRGVHEVNVRHIMKRKADRRSDEERSSLERMLKAYLKKPRDENDGEISDVS